MKTLDNVINEFSKLPGIGRKSAARIAFYILDMENEELERFSSI